MRWPPGFVRRLALGLLAGSCCLFAHAARANDFEQFEAARQAYDSQDYARATELFEELVGGDAPRLQNRSLVIESEKYVGASYLFLDKLGQAEAHFERLLQMDPAYMLDPLAFPEDVQRLFAQVKTRLDSERIAKEQALKRDEERRDQAKAERQRLEAARWQQLSRLAETERVHEVRSRWLAMVPFGVGQFQNGHDGLGVVLAVSEVSLLAISLTAYVLHEHLRGQKPTPVEIADARLAEQAFRYTSQISFGLFSVLAATGVIDAQVRYVATRSYDRQRPLPPGLRGGPELSLGPAGADFRIRF